MTRFFSRVAVPLLPGFRDGGHTLPDGFRMLREVYRGEQPDVAMVEFEDDNAPPYLEGLCVSPIFRRTFPDGNVSIMSYGFSPTTPQSTPREC